MNTNIIYINKMDDVCYHMFSFLSPKEIITFMKCNVSFYKSGHNHYIWKKFKDEYSKTFYKNNFYETYKICFQLIHKLKWKNTFDELINLRILSLSYNQIAHIPKEIGQLVNLQALFLSYNQIAHIPKEIGQLVNLRILNLRHNQIVHIPKEIGQLVHLQLSLANNPITHIPKKID